MTRIIARIDTKSEFVVKGIQLEGVKKLYTIDQLFKYLPEYLRTQDFHIDEIVLNVLLPLFMALIIITLNIHLSLLGHSFIFVRGH